MSNRSDPPPHESVDPDDAAAPAEPHGVGRRRRGASPALILAGVVLGLLVLAGVLIWLVTSLISEIGFPLGLGDSQPPAARHSMPVLPEAVGTSGARSPKGMTAAPEPAESKSGASRPARSEPAASSGPGNATALTVPGEGALVSAEGTFPETVLDEKASAAIRVPEHDEPLLVVWSNLSPRDSGTFFLTGYDRHGGDITEALSIVRDGRTGMRLIDLGPGESRTRMLYPKGNRGVSWRVRVFPLSALPEAERGERLAGNGPAALRLPAGKAGGYRLSVKGEGVPRIEVYDAGDLDLSTQFEYGTAPVDLDVTVGAGEQIIQVDADAEWLLEPR